MHALSLFFILAFGILVVVGMIVALRMNSFISLIVASVAVSLMAPGIFTVKISRVAEAFGAAAIGFGVQCGNWMNDSGFWIFAKMGGFTEVETLRTWTVTVSVMAVVGLLITVLFANWIPLV